MNYKIGIGLVVLIQLAISYITMLSGTGNGSFVGLGAMLLAIFGIPTTALINFLIISQYRKNPKPSYVKWLVFVSCILPFLQIMLLIAQLTLNL
jgi:hypothetical protein